VILTSGSLSAGARPETARRSAAGCSRGSPAFRADERQRDRLAVRRSAAKKLQRMGGR